MTDEFTTTIEGEMTLTAEEQVRALCQVLDCLVTDGRVLFPVTGRVGIYIPTGGGFRIFHTFESWEGALAYLRLPETA